MSVVTLVDAEVVCSVANGGSIVVHQTREGEPKQLLLPLLLGCGEKAGQSVTGHPWNRGALGTLELIGGEGQRAEQSSDSRE